MDGAGERAGPLENFSGRKGSRGVLSGLTVSNPAGCRLMAMVMVEWAWPELEKQYCAGYARCKASAGTKEYYEAH